MINKLMATSALLAILTFTSVGFTAEQIFDVIQEKEPAVKFETAQRFSQIFWG